MGEKHTTHAIGALIGATIVAMGLLSGSVNANVFICWVEHILLPNLPNKRGSVMHNASFHKGKDRQPMSESAGHVFLD
ncbi:hypothetical protein HCUR_00422 [Holospora curviuscula]|uniref:Uncharacterized protein n=3 Tax=Holospora curviuscula TaxID=1082868 RepID=A0A2S5R8C4_9PROT|nr:hypothetical protein HCUR_00995 [Holospora curviuscula]PPE04231.1 hypothetical protein HCUR_00422 [Holospora curviuscula]